MADFHCGLPGLHKERNNLTEKGLRLELVSNTTVVDINSGLLTLKTLEGNYFCGFNVQINYQIKMKPHHVMQATDIAFV